MNGRDRPVEQQMREADQAMRVLVGCIEELCRAVDPSIVLGALGNCIDRLILRVGDPQSRAAIRRNVIATFRETARNSEMKIGNMPAVQPNYVDIVFDGPPGPEAGRFVEVEDRNRRGIRFGEWIGPEHTGRDGCWVLRIDLGEVWEQRERRK